MRDDDDRPPPITRDLAVAWICSLAGALLLFLLLAPPALPHENMPWYRTLRTPEGFSCCNERDCRPAPHARIAGDHWEVRIGGAWVKVPPARVLRVPNPTGEAHVCHIGDRIICFVPGVQA